LWWAQKDSIGRNDEVDSGGVAFGRLKIKKNKGLFANLYLAETPSNP
jgi:hypothetical protein